MSIAVTFGGDPIAKSPFAVGVAEPLNINNVGVDNLDGRKTSPRKEKMSHFIT